MKNLLQKILDGLTYKDLAGRRQPRSYAVITGLLLFHASAGGRRSLVQSHPDDEDCAGNAQGSGRYGSSPYCNTYSAGLSSNASWLPHRSGKMVARPHLGRPELRS